MSRRLVVLLWLLLIPFLVNAQEDSTFQLTILHTNDTHSWHQGDGTNGGVARQATLQGQIRGEVDNILLLDAGDRFTGTLFHTTYRGQDQVQIMNALGYDAMSLGNHEFDNGDQVLADFITGVDFPVLAANVDASQSLLVANLIQPYTIVEVGGEQIGIIGLVTADTLEASSPGDELVFRSDYVSIANAYASELTEMGVNKIVLVMHIGIYVARDMVGRLDNIDIVVDGHSHTLLNNEDSSGTDYPMVYRSMSGEPVLYVQAGEHNLYLGRLDVEFDNEGVVTDWDGDTILLDVSLSEQNMLGDIVAELSVAVDALGDTEIGATTEVLLTGDRLFCRVEECALGDIITDAMRVETGADIAIMNGGGIRGDIPAGNITLGDVLLVNPFSNLISTFEISGADVIAALENGVSDLHTVAGEISREGLPGGFPQVSGIRYVANISNRPRSRIIRVEVEQADGSFAPIDPDAIYKVATINFLRTGGDGYTVFAENAIDPYDFGRLDYEVLTDYLVSISPITAEDIVPQGRITYEGPQPAPVN